jgi:hypothetical protein
MGHGIAMTLSGLASFEPEVAVATLANKMARIAWTLLAESPGDGVRFNCTRPFQ